MKLKKSEIIGGIYEYFDDEEFIRNINNLTFTRKAELRKLKTLPTNKKENENRKYNN